MIEPLPRSYDLLVIGGGVNGAGIARDAAGRGLTVLLCEKDDLASHTSGASTKLIHGGLRYLEMYEFGLVRKALAERERLLMSAPHIMRPMRFVIPHEAHHRPAWMIRLGLFLYDHLATRSFLGSSRSIDLVQHPAGRPLQSRFKTGFEYADGWVDDARLVCALCQDAQRLGAVIKTRCLVGEVASVDGRWQVSLVSREAAARDAVAAPPVSAKAIINAAGPWASQVRAKVHRPDAAPANGTNRIRLVKGSHIIVPKQFDHPFAYLFQGADGRVVFAIPYEDQFTLIGTTDVDYVGDPQEVHIDDAEVAYLCALVNRYFKRGLGPEDVVASYSGVRPLMADEHTNASAVTRDYRLEMEFIDGAPLLSVYGGKITTFRRLAEESVDKLLDVQGMNAPNPAPWTRSASLPGGDFTGPGPAEIASALARRYAWLPDPLRLRWARTYGTLSFDLLGPATSMDELGEPVLPGLHVREIRYLIEHEWARTAEDILKRRTKLYLHVAASAQGRLQTWIDENVTEPTP